MRLKFYFAILSLLIAIGLSLAVTPQLSAEPGWRDSSYFKIQTEKVENLKYVKKISYSNYYYTLTQSNLLTKWNYYTGQKVFEKQLTIPNDIDYFEISKDEYFFAFAKKDSSKRFYNIECRTIEYDAICRLFSTSSGGNNCEVNRIKLFLDIGNQITTSTEYIVNNPDSTYTFGINEKWWYNAGMPTPDERYDSTGQFLEHIGYFYPTFNTLSSDTLIKSKNQLVSDRKILISSYDYLEPELLTKNYITTISSEHFSDYKSHTIDYSNLVGADWNAYAFENQSDSNTILLKVNYQNYTYTESKLNTQLFNPIYLEENAIIARNNPKDSNISIYKFEPITKIISDSIVLNYNAKIVVLHKSNPTQELLLFSQDGHAIRIDLNQALTKFSSGWKDSLDFKIQTATPSQIKYLKFDEQKESFYTLNTDNRLTKWNIETGRKQFESKLNISPEDTYFELSDYATYYATAGMNPSKRYYDIKIYKTGTNELIRHIETNPKSRDTFPLNLYMYFGSCDNCEFTTSVERNQTISDTISTQAINESWGLYQYEGIYHDSLYSENRALVVFKQYSSDTKFYNYYSSISTNNPKTSKNSYELYHNLTFDKSLQKFKSFDYYTDSNKTIGINFSKFTEFTIGPYGQYISCIGYSPDSTILYKYHHNEGNNSIIDLDKRFYSPIRLNTDLLLASNNPNNSNLIIYKFNYPESKPIDSLVLDFSGKFYSLNSENYLLVLGNDGIIRQIDIYKMLINKSLGWINDGIKKTQTAIINTPKYFKISADGKSYFTLDYNNVLTKWSMETGLKEFEKTLNIPNKAMGFTISNLDEHYAYGVESDYATCSVELRKINDTSLVKSFSTYNPNYYVIQDFWVSSSELYIYIDDKSDSIITSTKYSYGSNHSTFYSGINEVNSLNQDTSIGNGYGVKSPINSIVQSNNTTKTLVNSYSGSAYNDGWVRENSGGGQLNIFNNLSNSFKKIYSNGYTSSSSSSGSNFSGEGCDFNSFTFNSNDSQLAFLLGTKKNNLGLIDLDSDYSVKRLNIDNKYSGLLYVKNDYLLTSKNNYYDKTAAFYLLNPVDGHAFDSLIVNYNEMGNFHPIPNSDKIFVQSNDGRYRILDLMPNIIHKEINFTCEKRVQLVQDTFIFNPIIPMQYDSLRWDFGDGNYSKDIQARHHYPKGGKYSINLRVYFENQESIETKKEYVLVIAPPKSMFEAETARGTIPFTFKIKNLSTGDIDSSSWFVDDSLVSHTIDLDFRATLPGTYSIKLVSSNAYYTDTLVKRCYINALNDVVSSIPCEYENELHTVRKSQYPYPPSIVNYINYVTPLTKTNNLIQINDNTLIDSLGIIKSISNDNNNPYKKYHPYQEGLFITHEGNNGIIYDSNYDSIASIPIAENTNISAVCQYNDMKVIAYVHGDGSSLSIYHNHKRKKYHNFYLCYFYRFDLFNPPSDPDSLIYFIGEGNVLTYGYFNKSQYNGHYREFDITSQFIESKGNISINQAKIIAANKTKITIASIRPPRYYIAEANFNKTWNLIASDTFNFKVNSFTYINNRILVVGQKNNSPLVAICDTMFNIISETIWTNRRGEFNDIQRTYDDGFILYGVAATQPELYSTPNAYYLKLSKDFYTQLADVNDEQISLNENKSSLFPNPANGTTNLQVNTEAGTQLNISIYDLQGREIHKLYEGNSDSKQLNLMFDAKKYCPNAGAYFIQIERNGLIETMRMIVE